MPALAFLLALGLQLTGAALAMLGAITFVAATPQDMADATRRLPALASLTELQLRTALAAVALLGMVAFAIGAMLFSGVILDR